MWRRLRRMRWQLTRNGGAWRIDPALEMMKINAAYPMAQNLGASNTIRGAES
jgi:hypothetical protein